LLIFKKAFTSKKVTNCKKNIPVFPYFPLSPTYDDSYIERVSKYLIKFLYISKIYILITPAGL
jgi:hypothetical protein